MITLFEHSEKRLGDILKFEAQIHGAKIDDKAPSVAPQASVEKPKGGFVFGDPEAYKDVPMEKREEMTRNMMNRHKIWAQESRPLGGKEARIG